MLYTPENARGADVYDVEARRQLRKVVTVDTDTGIVVMFHDPIRLNEARDEVEKFEVRFETIYPIFGGRTRPVLFHCYGRQA